MLIIFSGIGCGCKNCSLIPSKLVVESYMIGTNPHDYYDWVSLNLIVNVYVKLDKTIVVVVLTHGLNTVLFYAIRSAFITRLSFSISK